MPRVYLSASSSGRNLHLSGGFGLCLASILVCFGLGCARQMQPQQLRRFSVTKESAVLIAHDLGPNNEVLAYGANVDDGVKVEISSGLVAGRGEKFLFSSRIIQPNAAWSLVSVGAVSSATDDPVSEYWRQGQYKIEPAVAQSNFRVDGQAHVGPNQELNLRVNLGLARLWPVRRDSLVVSLRKSRAVALDGTYTSTGIPRFRPWKGFETQNTTFETSSAQLSNSSRSRDHSTATVSEQRTKLRALTGVAAPRSGFLKRRQNSAGFVIEDWALPTSFGTEGHMRTVRTATAPEPRPALIYFCGHFNGGVRHPAVNRFLLEAARNGYVASAVDLLGYGYRQGPESAHVLAAYLTLLGKSAIQPFIEEAESALETMRKLPSVVPERISVTGISMGGSIAMLLTALRPDIQGVVAMGGTADFEAFARPIGSDSEQHFRGFQEMGGFSSLPKMIAPRPMSLIFPKGDEEHGEHSNKGVVNAAKAAYVDVPANFHSFVGDGKHEQSKASRRDLLQEVNRHNSILEYRTYDATWLPSVEPRYVQYEGLRTQISRLMNKRSRIRKMTPQNSYSSSEVTKRVLTEPGDQPIEVQLTFKGEAASALAWRFPVEQPYEKVMILEDSGAPAAGFAPLMQACGFDVTVLQLPTFGTSASTHQAWHRKLLSLLSVSLNQDMASSWVHQLSAALKALGSFESILTFGPESGALAMLAYSEGALSKERLVMADAPQSLNARFKAGYAPYWTSYVPGLLQRFDFDQIASELASKNLITVVSGGSGLGLGEFPVRHPIINRATAIEVLLEKYDLLHCIRPLPVLKVRQ